MLHTVDRRRHAHERVCMSGCSYVVTNKCYCSHGFLDAVEPTALPFVSVEA